MPTTTLTKTTLTLAISLILLPLHHASASEIPCEFDANAEWPWVEDRVCQSDQPSTTLIANDAATGEVPVCILESSDPDGDGWGWENNESCKTPTADKVEVVGFPICVNPNSDSDNDGWGWENNSTCVSNVSKPIISTVITHASCSDNSTDPDGDGWGFENGSSCKVPTTNAVVDTPAALVPDNTAPDTKAPVETTVATKPKAPVETTTVINESASSVVYQQDFDSSTLGSYTGDTLNQEWDTPFWHMGFNQGRVHITQELGHGNAMRVTYPANKYGAAGASAFLTDVEFGVDLPKSYNELFVSYDIKFAEGFDFVRGGKLPGLCGHDNTQSPYSGCNTGGGFPDGYDGWSARGMWREGGAMENYVYHSDQESYYGDDEFWGVVAKPGQWHTIQHRVVLNDVGQANGIIEAWFDGKKVLSETDFIYRKSDQIGVNLFYFSTFYGGNDLSWAPTEDQFVYFDNIQISTESNDDLIPKGLALSDVTLELQDSGKTSGGSGGGSLNALFIALLLSFKQLQARRHSRPS